MRPLQVWLPNITGTLAWPRAERDRSRAYEEWRGEDCVWLIPGLEEPFRWVEKEDVACLAVPAEHWERLDVCHVGKNGAVYGPGANERFRDGRIDGLFDAWLNTSAAGGVKFYPGPDKLTLQAPQRDGRKVRYEVRHLHLEPGATAPSDVDEENDSGGFTLRWPPAGVDLPTISPEAESHELYGPFDPVQDDGKPIAVRRADKTQRALRVILEWPGPLRALFPSGSGLDDLYAYARMRSLARQSQADLDGARSAAQIDSAKYLTDGETCMGPAWLGPILAAEREEGALFALEARYGISASSIAEAEQTDEWRGIMREPVPIRRAWGAVGLFWALMLDRLEEGRNFNVCQRCGRILQGKRGKRFCGRADDIKCFQERRAADRRRERNKQKRE